MQQNKSNKQIYAENRELYFDKVISSYSHGMTVREIANKFPISKSTVQRWVNDYTANECDELPENIELPRTPASVAKTIRAMQSRITRLETELEMYRNAEIHVEEGCQQNVDIKNQLVKIRTAMRELCELVSLTIENIK